MKTKWYVARLVVRCRVGEDDAGPWTIDEQVHVLRATGNEIAYEKALQIGRDEEHSYLNALGETVYWEFVGLTELDELMDKSIRDGTEITYRLYKSNDPTSLVPEKGDLTLFWSERNKHRTASEILEQHDIDSPARKILGYPSKGPLNGNEP